MFWIGRYQLGPGFIPLDGEDAETFSVAQTAVAGPFLAALPNAVAQPFNVADLALMFEQGFDLLLDGVADIDQMITFTPAHDIDLAHLVGVYAIARQFLKQIGLA